MDPNPPACEVVLECALQVAFDGAYRAKSEHDEPALKAYYDVLSSAYALAATLGYEMPNDVLQAFDPDDFVGLKPHAE